jgi:hypothetical protein
MTLLNTTVITKNNAVVARIMTNWAENDLFIFPDSTYSWLENTTNGPRLE